MSESASALSGTSTWVDVELSSRGSVNKYRIERFLAMGGMANVFIARRSDGSAVVVKIPKPHVNEGDAKRFAREIQILLTANHPNIVPIFDVGEVNGLPFIVMPYLGGGSLRDRIKPRTHAAPNAIHSWLMPIAEALDAIHARQLYHRDVKPDNILFDNVGRAYLTDFGIVKPTAGNMTNLTNTGGVLGTAWYMAPEAFEGKPIDHRADQYALAASVYELLAGQVPFSGETIAVIYVNQLRKRPQPLDGTGMPWTAALSEAVLKGLALKPNARYLNCRELATAILSKLPAPVAEPLPTQAIPAQESPVTTTVHAVADTKSGDRTHSAPPVVLREVPDPITPWLDPIWTTPDGMNDVDLIDPKLSKSEFDPPKRKRPRWTYLIIGIFVLMSATVLFGPTAWMIFFGISDGFKLNHVLASIGLGSILFACGTSLFLIPVKMGVRERVIRRRTIWFPIIGSSLLATLLFAGFAFGFYEFWGGKRSDGSTLFLWVIPVVWIAWLTIFSLVGVKQGPASIGDWLWRTLLVGSVAELLIAVPMHIVVRNRGNCCAGIFTGFGIGVGVIVMVVALGPAVFVLCYRRYRQVYSRER